MPPFFFDFTLAKTEIPDEQVVNMEQAAKIADGTNRCTYPIPKIDEIVKLIDKATYRVDKSKLISDVLACGAIAISNMVDLSQYDKREKEYLQIINSYRKYEQQLICDIFAKIFALLSSVVYDNGVFNDYLGELFMKCNLGNKKMGQCFTPYHICKFMANVAIDNPKEIIADKGILTICDPCCGGGAMAIAALDVLKNEYNINYARDCFIECDDLDIRCVHMAYLQLSLAGVPAKVCHQDSLTLQRYSEWHTPAFILQYPRFARFV